ncbi:YbaB/EbfC family nucleoid-associated protein [Nonomuraea maritima]|uniref:YbaB/EbfC family nucleoid-associated protein n=1 Tax=Nonomuraea maritima TaxID=683260 RepID=UPI00371C8AF1
MHDFAADPDGFRDDDIARAEEEAERILAWTDRAQAELQELTGTGESPSGQVTAVVAASGRVVEVSLRPRAMRLDSRTLSEEVLAAVASAGHDVTRRVEELIRQGLPGFDPGQAVARVERVMNMRWR